MIGIVFIVLFGLIGGLLSRWHGGGFLSGSPKTLKNILWALPFGLCSLSAVLPYTTNLVSVLIATTALCLCVAGKATGHGRVWNPYSPLDETKKPEKLEHLIMPLRKILPAFWYKFIAMALIGFSACSGAVFAFGYVNVWSGCLVAIGGLLKAVAYVFGRKFQFIFSDFGDELDEPTEIGEFLTGFFAYTFLALALIQIA
jgi:hypothetical protein